MLSIFGYLVFAIFYTWSVDWVALAEPAPSLISLLISFFMSPGAVPPDAVLFAGQATVQAVLLGLAFVTVPWMLLAKPLLLRRRHLQVSGYKTLKATTAEGSRLIDNEADMCSDTSSDKHGKYHHDEFDFAEVMIHQGIHSIEYVLTVVHPLLTVVHPLPSQVMRSTRGSTRSSTSSAASRTRRATCGCGRSRSRTSSSRPSSGR